MFVFLFFFNIVNCKQFDACQWFFLALRRSSLNPFSISALAKSFVHKCWGFTGKKLSLFRYLENVAYFWYLVFESSANAAQEFHNGFLSFLSETRDSLL